MLNEILTAEQCQRARLSRDPRFDGLFYILVQSTGVFCRPTCSVKSPKEENVSYAFSAIDAMHKGYRPCLRCRPDSAPGSFAWKGIETTVERGLSLIATSPGKSIQSIAARLGVSTRYLQQLFIRYLGLAPKQYMLFQQLLMAKNLLHQTNMSVELVAQNVGFSNARQLQLHSKKHLKLTPREIRRNQHLPETDNVRVYLPYNPPYQWPQLRDFLRLRQIEGNEVFTENSIVKHLAIDGDPVEFTVTHEAEKHRFRLEYSPLCSKHSQSIISKAKTLLDLHVSPMLVEQSLTATGLEKNRIIHGIRIPGVVSRLEAGCRAILGQQVSLKQAVVLLNQLQIHLADGSLFPSARTIADSDLSFIKMPGARKQALRSLADAFASEPDINTDDLLNIKGIGPWTCNYIKMRTHESTDIWLENDLVIKQQVAVIEQSCPTFTPESAAPWRSYLTMNLWNTSN